jgi:hypothetical protein
MQQFLNLIWKRLNTDTSKIVASYALPEPLESDDVYFLTGEWTNALCCFKWIVECHKMGASEQIFLG